MCAWKADEAMSCCSFELLAGKNENDFTQNTRLYTKFASNIKFRGMQESKYACTQVYVHST